MRGHELVVGLMLDIAEGQGETGGGNWVRGREFGGSSQRTWARRSRKRHSGRTPTQRIYSLTRVRQNLQRSGSHQAMCPLQPCSGTAVWQNNNKKKLKIFSLEPTVAATSELRPADRAFQGTTQHMKRAVSQSSFGCVCVYQAASLSSRWGPSVGRFNTKWPMSSRKNHR